MAPEGDGLVEVGASDVELGARAQVPELLLVPANADTDDQPPARKRVERRQLLGQDDGVPLWHDDDRRPQAEAGMLRADPRERLDRVEVRPIVGGVVAAI